MSKSRFWFILLCVVPSIMYGLRCLAKEANNGAWGWVALLGTGCLCGLFGIYSLFKARALQVHQTAKR